MPINLDGKQRKLFRQKATDLLITHPNNMLDKIEALSVCSFSPLSFFLFHKPKIITILMTIFLSYFLDLWV